MTNIGKPHHLCENNDAWSAEQIFCLQTVNHSGTPPPLRPEFQDTIHYKDIDCSVIYVAFTFYKTEFPMYEK